IKNLHLVESAPWLLAAFLAALATAALAHALMVCVRAGRRDLAVLRTLGFVRRQVGATIRWQASATTAIGLATGVPTGLVVGRWIWRQAAGSTGALVEPVTTPLLGALVPFWLVLACLIAAVPARVAARMHPAEILRAE
ncbi:MAG TPA: FtsX-like permease family protein, partial [Acidimicrobiales bacterium]|nr:FtsX-like permease family protein [Acidimicrobiales bacterium]